MTAQILCGDCQQILPTLPDCSIDAIVTDPPYELGFMGKAWDATGVAYQVDLWRECLRVLKPGGHLLAFGGSRTYHRLACAVEDAGFQVRDQIMWVYGSGFPKSHDVSKAIDRAAGATREVIGETRRGAQQESTGRYGAWGDGITPTAPATHAAKRWQGWGTALKPAHEPIVLARKPLDGTVADNVLTHSTGGINIDGCRVEAPDGVPQLDKKNQDSINCFGSGLNGSTSLGFRDFTTGRFPANFIHDGSDEVLELFPETVGGARPAKAHKPTGELYEGGWGPIRDGERIEFAGGSAARFFYCAKASKKDRNEGLDEMPSTMRKTMSGGEWVDADGKLKNRPAATQNHHPTVKPTDLMRYLCRLITPPNGTILDPFTGSGSTGKAAALEGFDFIGIEQSAEYVEIATARIRHAHQQT